MTTWHEIVTETNSSATVISLSLMLSSLLSSSAVSVRRLCRRRWRPRPIRARGRWPGHCRIASRYEATALNWFSCRPAMHLPLGAAVITHNQAKHFGILSHSCPFVLKQFNKLCHNQIITQSPHIMFALTSTGQGGKAPKPGKLEHFFSVIVVFILSFYWY